MYKITDLFFYIIYTGAKTPGKKRRLSRKDDAKRLFTVAGSFYIAALLTLLIFTIFNNVITIQINEGFILVFLILILFTFIPFAIFTRRRFTYTKIDELDDKYEAKINFKYARIFFT